MSSKERTAMSNLVTNGTVAETSTDSTIVAALTENKPVMLVHALNGGYLRPADLTATSHDKGVKLSTALDPATKEAEGHLWYITPGGFFGKRRLYFIESAAGQAPEPDAADDTETAQSADGSPKPRRRRITVHQDAPKADADALQVGLPGKVGEKWRGKSGENEDTQRWIVTVTSWGGITFVPVTHPDTILGFKDHAVTADSEVRVTYNWGGDFTGTVVNTFYPRLVDEWNVPYHHVFT